MNQSEGGERFRWEVGVSHERQGPSQPSKQGHVREGTGDPAMVRDAPLPFKGVFPSEALLRSQVARLSPLF